MQCNFGRLDASSSCEFLLGCCPTLRVKQTCLLKFLLPNRVLIMMALFGFEDRPSECKAHQHWRERTLPIQKCANRCSDVAF